MKPHVLIIGGTRFIGPPVVRRLLAAGCEVTLLHRGRTGNGLFAELRHIIADRKDLPSRRNEIKSLKPDIVLDMIPLGEDDARTVMATCRGIARRVVALSSGDVYRAYGRLIRVEPGPPDTVPLNEESPLRDRLFPYRGQSERLENYEKILAERHFLGDAELKGTVLRLPVVYGPGDYQHRLWTYLRRLLDGRPAILLESAHAQWRISRAFVENVADAVVMCILEERAAGHIYNVAEPVAWTETEWITQIAAAAGADVDIVALPGDRYPELVDKDFDPAQDLVFDSTRIRRELGYCENVRPDVALKATVDWESTNQPAEAAAEAIDYELEDRILDEINWRPLPATS